MLTTLSPDSSAAQVGHLIAQLVPQITGLADAAIVSTVGLNLAGTPSSAAQ